MKKKNPITKHDLRRSIQSIYQQLNFVTERLRVTETLFNDFIDSIIYIIYFELI